MNESSLPPPPTNGSANGLILVGVVMLAAVGGLLLWKSSQDAPVETPSEPAQTSALAAAVSAAPAVAPPSMPPPPPPPPEEAPPAPVEVGPSPTQGSGKPESPCASTCAGTAPAALKAALAGRARQARGCYQSALQQDTTLEGKLLVAVRVGPSGVPCSVSMSQDSLGSSVVAGCVLSKFRSGTYPKPEGGCVDTQVPINFVSRK